MEELVYYMCYNLYVTYLVFTFLSQSAVYATRGFSMDWLHPCLLNICWCVDAVELVPVQERADVTNYQPVLTPPEGNTTFLDGTSWCVACPGVSQGDLQDALDWACGMGKTDCGPIKSGGPCFEPITLLSHASFAFNSYYPQYGNSDISCNLEEQPP